LFVVTPSSIRWGDRVEDELLTHTSNSEGAQTQVSWTPSSEGVTGPPRTASVSELSRQRAGARASEHQRLMRRSGRAPGRIEPHLATETGRSGSGSTSGGSYLVRGQAEDLGEMSRSRYYLLRFGYLGKWSPCVYESLNTKGETITLVTLLYDSNFTLT
jgi:hypothetical protein